MMHNTSHSGDADIYDSSLKGKKLDSSPQVLLRFDQVNCMLGLKWWPFCIPKSMFGLLPCPLLHIIREHYSISRNSTIYKIGLLI